MWTPQARSRAVADSQVNRALAAVDLVESSLRQINADWDDLAALLADLAGTGQGKGYAEGFQHMLQFRDALRAKMRQAPSPARPTLSSRLIRKI